MTEQATDPVHGHGWNTADRWGGWSWREPRGAEHFRRCSFCGSIHPEDLAAEQAGDGTCRVCGEHGWEACFRAQKAPWMTAEALAGLDISDEERARVGALHPAHNYDPGGWYASWADRVRVAAQVPRQGHRQPPSRNPADHHRAQPLPGRPHGARDRLPVVRHRRHPAGTDVSGWRLEDGHYTHVGLGSDPDAPREVLHGSPGRSGDQRRDEGRSAGSRGFGSPSRTAGCPGGVPVRCPFRRGPGHEHRHSGPFPRRYVRGCGQFCHLGVLAAARR